MTERIPGIHHVTAITADPQGNVDFYCGVLGLRLVKLTVNFDDPQSYHLYYGDELGRPGTILTFFAWPGARAGRPGPPQVITTSFSVPEAALGFWEKRLATSGAEVGEPFTRLGDRVLPFSDMEGMGLELVAPSTRDQRIPWQSGPVPAEHAIRGFHGITISEEAYEHTATLLTRTLGFERAGEEGNRFRHAATDGVAESVVDLVCEPDRAHASIGASSVHHVAFRTPDDPAQEDWRELLVGERYNVSPVMDRSYFHSIYFREPGGVLFEIATDTPGFLLDEPLESLGTALKLPRQYERLRPAIEAALPRLRLPRVERT